MDKFNYEELIKEQYELNKYKEQLESNIDGLIKEQYELNEYKKKLEKNITVSQESINNNKKELKTLEIRLENVNLKIQMLEMQRTEN